MQCKEIQTRKIFIHIKIIINFKKERIIPKVCVDTNKQREKNLIPLYDVANTISDQME